MQRVNAAKCGAARKREVRRPRAAWAYFTATATVNFSVLPGATKWRPSLFSGALGGPIQGSTQ